MKARKLLFLFLLILIASCAAKGDYYKSKGVHYFTKPVKELTSYTPIQYPPDHNSFGENPLLVGSNIIFPVFHIHKNTSNNSTIYSYDTQKHAIKDSLVIPEYNLSRVCADDMLYFIGRDANKNMIIITTDKSLQNRIDTTFPMENNVFITDTYLWVNQLYILMMNDNHQYKYTSIDITNMKLQGEVILPDSIAVAKFNKDSVYYIENGKGNLRYGKLSLTSPDAKPIIHEINYQIVSSVKPPEWTNRNLTINGDHLIFSYPKDRDFDKSIGQFNVVLIDMLKNTFVSKTLEGATWSLLYNDSKLYAFKSIFKPSYVKTTNYQVLTLTELDSNLKNEKELITFFPREWNYAFNMLMEDNNNIALIGSFMGKIGSSVFIADYNLK